VSRPVGNIVGVDDYAIRPIASPFAPHFRFFLARGRVFHFPAVLRGATISCGADQRVLAGLPVPRNSGSGVSRAGRTSFPLRFDRSEILACRMKGEPTADAQLEEFAAVADPLAKRSAPRTHHFPPLLLATPPPPAPSPSREQRGGRANSHHRPEFALVMRSFEDYCFLASLLRPNKHRGE